jgi:hypothetical protein
MKIEIRDVNDDWVELWVNDELRFEGHSIPLRDAIEQIAPDAFLLQTQVYRCIYCEADLPDGQKGTFRCEKCRGGERQ